MKTWCLLPLLGVLGFAHPAEAQLGGLFGKSIETIDTASLGKLIKKRQAAVEAATRQGQPVPESDFVVVDVRSDQEVAVSMIPGAILKKDFEMNRKQYRGKTVIPYCLVGGRSSAYAKKLVADDFAVKNYKESILGWIGGGLPLQTLDGKPTKRVHVASSRYKVPTGYTRVQ
ncbi:MAG: rhodanese-like domain-containing protein [Planctomycetota bacterium]